LCESETFGGSRGSLQEVDFLRPFVLTEGARLQASFSRGVVPRFEPAWSSRLQVSYFAGRLCQTSGHVRYGRLQGGAELMSTTLQVSIWLFATRDEKCQGLSFFFGKST
jgi:hypothetical protein